MKLPSLLFSAAALVALTLPLPAQKMQTPAGEAPGPWLLGTIGVGKQPDGTMTTTALKGLAIKVGPQAGGTVAYDLDLCRIAGAWTGTPTPGHENSPVPPRGTFVTPMNLMSRGEYPTAIGEVAFTTGEMAGFLGEDAAASWKDPRKEPFGPLPQGQVRFKGFYVNGDKTVLQWDFAGTEVLEMPGYEFVMNGGAYFTRTLSIAPSKSPTRILVSANLETDPGAPIDQSTHRFIPLEDPTLKDKEGLTQATPWVHTGDREVMIWAAGEPDGSKWRNVDGELVLEIPATDEGTTFQIAYWRAPLTDPTGRTAPLFFRKPEIDLHTLLKGGTAHWPESVTTAGETASGNADAAYVADTIKLPDPNPWGAPMFIGGFDFFPDGRAAVCTFHGDVFIVSGLDDSLGKVTWKRFASGLYHALGLKIVNGEIYVTCRDGLWRLHDLNGDGECDYYEAFNHDIMVTKSFHEFVFDLQTDPAGNFYFTKAGPVKNGGRGFDEICADHGAMFKVSPDGKKFEVIATGFRAPNGMGCGPHGELTSGDNEGTWTPVCRLNWITPGGFYGVPPLSHRTPAPTDYDRPLCWMPKRVDNSSGSQVWVTSDKWGPWKDQLLHLSYGTCSILGVLHEEVSGVDVPSATTPRPATVQQGGVVRFPLNFQSGIMRARFNPVDGQLYVAGLRGWQTTGVKNGCFQRVRYQAGAPVRMPIGLHTTKRGIRLDFACELDAASAGDVQNWGVEVWNYLWSSAYGSPDVSTLGADTAPTEVGKDGAMQFTSAQMAQKKHDPLTVKSATVSADKKSVFLEIPEIKPVMQMSIKFGIQSADGGELRSEVVNTIHALSEK